MALRLLSETAANDVNKNLQDFIKANFSKAKQSLDQDSKTTLANQNVNEGSMVQLLHTGAHNYKSSNNIDQTIAVSIILAEILKLTHGRAN